MSVLWSQHCQYQVEPYSTEGDLEEAVQEVSGELFGPSRIYLDIKKKIGVAGKTTNIPDGYLIDLSSSKQPLLYVVENELAKHHPLKHIAVQILEFSLSFDATPQLVKSIVRHALDSKPEARHKCEEYAHKNGFENVDYLLEQMVYKNGFQALVIIDELHDELETVLVGKFRFGVEVLTLTRYRNVMGERIYQFEPFLADVTGMSTMTSMTDQDSELNTNIDPSEIDTIVVPARDEGFYDTAIGQKRWYAVRIHGSIIPKIKYLAVYRVSPISAITHLSPIQSIEPWQNSGKYALNFAEPLQEVGPIKLVPGGKIKAPQNARYTSCERLMNATNLDEAF